MQVQRTFQTVFCPIGHNFCQVGEWNFQGSCYRPGVRADLIPHAAAITELTYAGRHHKNPVKIGDYLWFCRKHATLALSGKMNIEYGFGD
jgi:hypothetical protein